MFFRVVVDLGHRRAETGEACLVLQGGAQAVLHGGQPALHLADLVGTAARLDDAGLVLRVVAEAAHVLGQPQHRPDDHEMQAEVDQGRRDQRDEKGEREDALGEGDHLVLHRRLVHDQLDQDGRVLGRGPHHPQDPPPLGAERQEGVADQAEEADIAKVDGLRNLEGRATAEHQLAAAAPGQRHALGPDMGQQLDPQVVTEHLVRRGVERQHRQMGGAQALLQIGQAEAADRGCVDQHLGQHHESDGQEKQPDRQARENAGKAELRVRHSPEL